MKIRTLTSVYLRWSSVCRRRNFYFEVITQMNPELQTLTSSVKVVNHLYLVASPAAQPSHTQLQTPCSAYLRGGGGVSHDSSRK